MGWQADGLEALVADLIARHGLTGRVIISSFNPLRLRRMRRIAPQLPLGFLHDWETPVAQRWLAATLMLGLPVEADHPHHVRVTPAYIREVHRRGQRVNVWVVNEPERMRELRDAGVDLIMSDRPDLLRTVLHGER